MHIPRPSIKDHIYLASLLSSETTVQYPYALVNVSSTNKESILSYVSKTRKVSMGDRIGFFFNLDILTGQTWLAQLVRPLPSDQMIPSLILALLRFEYLCDLFCLR